MGHARGHRAGGHLDPLRRAARHRPDRHHAADRLHLGQPLRLHRAGHLRDDLASAAPARRSTWSTTASPPRRCSSSRRCSSRRRGSKRIPDFGGWQRVTPVLAGVVPRRRPLRAGAAGPVDVRLASSSCSSAPSSATAVAAVIATLGHHPRRALHPADVPADDDRAQAGDRRAGTRDLSHRARSGVVAPLIAAFLVLGFYPKPVLDVINPAVAKTLQLHRTSPTLRRPTATQLKGARSDRLDRRPWRRPTFVSREGRLRRDRCRCSIVFGAALVGVLVEAFAPRTARLRHPGRPSRSSPRSARVSAVARAVVSRRPPGQSPLERRGRHRRPGAVPAGHVLRARPSSAC